MSQSLVNFRMDSDLKKDMEETCRELGMNMTTAFIIYAKKVTREKRIPFDVSIDPFYSASNMQRLKESSQQEKDGKIISKSMRDLEEME